MLPHSCLDGGFSNRVEDDSNSDIVSTYFAVRTLSLLDAEIEKIESLRSLLCNRRRVNGGWARDSKHDNPHMRYTVLAVDLKRRLDEIAVPTPEDDDNIDTTG